jgi:hypothetical protein
VTERNAYTLTCLAAAHPMAESEEAGGVSPQSHCCSWGQLLAVPMRLTELSTASRACGMPPPVRWTAQPLLLMSPTRRPRECW